MKSIKIGRDHSNDVIIDDKYVSSSHAIITITDSGDVYIDDTLSKNGTFVNGVRITEKTRLSSSSVVRLGNYFLDWKRIVNAYNGTTAKPQIEFPSDIVEKKLIGRDKSAQVWFAFDDVSKNHAYLCKTSNGAVVLIDNHSTNGTFVNGERITAPRELKRNDTVLLSNRHPLNWESIYPIKKIRPEFIAIACAVVLLVAGLFIFKPWNHFSTSWTKIYEEHKNDVVLICRKSTYRCTVNGMLVSNYLNGDKKFNSCHLNENGFPLSGPSIVYGTGFFISKDGKFLSNRHVVEDKLKEENCKKLRRAIQTVLVKNGLDNIDESAIRVDYVTMSIKIARNDTSIGSETELIPSTVIGISDNEELDVALLQTNSKTLPDGATFVDLPKYVRKDDLEVGTEICTIGFPNGFAFGVTDGGLYANNQSGEISQKCGTYLYGHNINILQGASGSPIYDRKGNFAGIIVSGFFVKSQGYNYAIQPEPIIDFVEKFN